MQQERVMLKLVILCMTLIAFIWLTRGSLCIAHQAGRLGGCGHFGLRIRTVRQPNGGFAPPVGRWCQAGSTSTRLFNLAGEYAPTARRYARSAAH